MDGEQMIRTIALNKEKDREEAKKAFILFCGCYEVRATQMALTLCERWKKPESDAYQIVECAIEKIWLYPSFDRGKTNCKDDDRAILWWINSILVHELTMLSQNGGCSHPEAEDLPMITNPSEFIAEKFKDDYLSDEDFERMKKVLDKLVAGLNEQEITIYLTYKLYETPGKKVPRNVLNKLRTRFNISQDGIRKCQWRVKEKIEGGNYER